LAMQEVADRDVAIRPLQRPRPIEQADDERIGQQRPQPFEPARNGAVRHADQPRHFALAVLKANREFDQQLILPRQVGRALQQHLALASDHMRPRPHIGHRLLIECLSIEKLEHALTPSSKRRVYRSSNNGHIVRYKLGYVKTFFWPLSFL